MFDACHKKTDLKVFVVVVPKEGWALLFKNICHMMSAESNSEKSVSYQKKDARGHARPSFFWYDNDKDLEVNFLVTHLT